MLPKTPNFYSCIRAAYDPIEEKVAQRPSEPSQIDTEPGPMFAYTIKVACEQSDFKQHVSRYLSPLLSKTTSEHPLSHWVAITDGKHTQITCNIMIEEEKRLVVTWKDNPRPMWVRETVMPHPKDAVVITESWLPLRPAILCGKQLGLPTKGYIYHYVNGNLIHEYRCLGGTQPQFLPTRSRQGEQSSDTSIFSPLSFIVVPWQQDGKTVEDQYLLYRREVLLEEEFNAVDNEFLAKHGVKLDMAKLIALTEQGGRRKHHLVTSGECLSSISTLHQIDEKTLLELNPYWHKNALMLGNKLYLEPLEHDKHGTYHHIDDVTYPAASMLLADGVFSLSTRGPAFPVVKLAESDICAMRVISLVRYAIDETDDKNKPLNPIQDLNAFPGGRFNDEKNKELPYTLRQLRDGWLYVLSLPPDIKEEPEAKPEQWTVNEYQVISGELHFVLGNTCAERENNKPEGACAHLMLKNDRRYYFSFSVKRWSDRVQQHFCTDENARTIWLREVDLRQGTLPQQHMAPIDKTEELVADVGDVDKTAFSGTCAPLFQDRGPNDFVCSVTPKNIASYTYQVPPVYQQHILALEDPLGDLSDLILQLLSLVLALSPDEETQRKTVIAEAIRSMVRVPLPSDVLSNLTPIEVLDLENELDECFAEINSYHNSENVRKFANPFYNDANYDDAKNKLNKKLNELKINHEHAYFKDSQRDAGNDVTYFSEYKQRLDAHKQVRWPDLDAFYKKQLLDQTDIKAKIPPLFENILAALPKLGTKPMNLGLDIEQGEGKAYLYELFGTLLPALDASANEVEDLRETLEKALIQETPDNLMALSHVGFSPEFDVKAKELFKDRDLINLKEGEMVPVSGAFAAIKMLMSTDGKGSSFLNKTQKFIGPIDALMNDAIKASVEAIYQVWLTASLVAKRGNNVAARALFFASSTLMNLTNTKIELNKPEDINKWKELFQKQIDEINRAEVIADDPNQPNANANKNALKAKIAKLKQMSEMAPLPIKAIQIGDETISYSSKVFNKIKTGSNKSFEAVGGRDFVVLFFNMINVVMQQQTLNEVITSGNTSEKEVRGQKEARNIAILWSMHAGADILRGKAFARISYNSELIDKKIGDIYAKDGRKLVGRYLVRSFVTGMFGALAAGLEARSVLDSAKKATSEVERDLLHAKSGILIGQVGIWGLLAIRSLLGCMGLISFSAVSLTWMLTGLFWLNIGYLVVILAINFFEKTALEKWLNNCVWGNEPNKDWSAETEYRELLKQLNAPTLQGKITKYRRTNQGTSYVSIISEIHQTLTLGFPQLNKGDTLSLAVSLPAYQAQNTNYQYHSQNSFTPSRLSQRLSSEEIKKGEWILAENAVPCYQLIIPWTLAANDTLDIYVLLNEKNPFETEKTTLDYHVRLRATNEESVLMESVESVNLNAHTFEELTV